MTADVKHMKWWGWGNEGVGFHHEDKPGFAPFVARRRRPRPAHRHAARASRRSTTSRCRRATPRPRFTKTLAGIVGDEHVSTDDMLRVVHTYGKSLRDLVRIRNNWIERAPDVVVYPADEAEVLAIVQAAVAADAVIIPFGGGSNIAGSLEPMPDREAHRRLARPRSPAQGHRDRRRSPGSPASRPAPRAPTSRSSSTSRAGRSGTSPTASPTRPSAAGSPPARAGMQSRQVRRHRRHRARPARRARRAACSCCARCPRPRAGRACAR